MAKIISLFNIKGGVGKTTTTVNLAYASAKAGYKTLLWDMDPQGASSFYFRINNKVKGGFDGIISGKHEVHEHVKGSDYPDLDILPADMSYRQMDKELDEAGKPPIKLLKKLLLPLFADYDYVFIDCPPHLSEAVTGVIALSDLLVIPSIPTILSMRTVKQLRKFISKDQQIKTPFRVLFSLVDARRKMHKEMIAYFLEKKSAAVFNTSVPVMSDIEKMGYVRAPIGEIAPRHRASKIYEDLFFELTQAMVDKKMRRIEPEMSQ
jgi:cellulose biosynthesis protein BcsQ